MAAGPMAAGRMAAGAKLGGAGCMAAGCMAASSGAGAKLVAPGSAVGDVPTAGEDAPIAAFCRR